MRAETKAEERMGMVLDVSESDNIHAQAGLLDTWNQHYSQLSPGPFKGGVTSLHSPNMRFFIEQMNRSVFQKGDVGTNRIGFGIPAKMLGKCNICGEVAEELNLLVFSGEGGFEFLSPEDFLFFGIEIQSPPGDGLDLAVLVHRLDEHLRRERRVIRLDKLYAANLIRLFQSAFQVVDATQDTTTEQARIRNMQRQFVGTVVDFLDASAPPKENSKSARNHWTVVKKIHESVIAVPDCPLSVAELSIRLNVSRRTLQNAVANTLDMSPLGLLRALRLSEVRREIGSATSVTDIATRWGFWHFGYFARNYRAMFGELPSETLARRR
jgi:AraC family ethanolamine operon transcriptional activator